MIPEEDDLQIIYEAKDSNMFYEPLAVRPNYRVTGADLNNLKTLGKDGQEAWAAEKTDLLRRACRRTAEALAAISLTSTLM